MRRDAVEALENLLITDHETVGLSWLQSLKICHLWLLRGKVQYSEPMVSARVDELEAVKAAIEGGAKKIIFGGDRLQRKPYELSIYEQVAKLCKDHNVLLCICYPSGCER